VRGDGEVDADAGRETHALVGRPGQPALAVTEVLDQPGLAALELDDSDRERAAGLLTVGADDALLWRDVVVARATFGGGVAVTLAERDDAADAVLDVAGQRRARLDGG